jgi:hypothetical protein
VASRGSGYRQFCTHYLYPLLLEAYRGVAFQPWLRGSPDGIPPEQFRGLFTSRDALRRGMLKHVFLLASLERRNAGSGADVRRELSEAGFDSRMVKANVEGLAKLVDGLRSASGHSSWEDYRATCSYDDENAEQKAEFVQQAVARTRRRLVWDLGCNDGRYAELASAGAELTLAVDSDPAVVDLLYRSLRDDGNERILPLVVDLLNPSPAIGWRNAERGTLAERGRPELVLCLALVHHLSITGNVPLREVVAWLRGLGCEVVVEFPHRDDPMVEGLLAAKRDGAHPDYDVTLFETTLRAALDVVESRMLASGTRTLYLARPR